MTTETKQQTRILVQAAAAACEEKKGTDTRILELDPIDSGLSDFFLITSASNDRQSIAIADEIEHKLKKDFGVYPNSVEGRRHGEWILIDYVDFVAHVFLAERRAFYDIERLRKSARPLTPAEFDAELKAELAAKTLAARSKKVAAKVKKPAVKAKPAAAVKPKKTAVKKAAKKAPAGVKAAIKPKKTAKATTKKKATTKAPAAKKAAGTAKKLVAKKASAKKAVAPKSTRTAALAKKVAVRKKAAKKTAPGK
jgi:ribosome-associated protein